MFLREHLFRCNNCPSISTTYDRSDNFPWQTPQPLDPALTLAAPPSKVVNPTPLTDSTSGQSSDAALFFPVRLPVVLAQVESPLQALHFMFFWRTNADMDWTPYPTVGVQQCQPWISTPFSLFSLLMLRHFIGYCVLMIWCAETSTTGQTLCRNSSDTN